MSAIQYFPNADLFAQGAACIINPVNCRGVMGKGLALTFAKRYPAILDPYKKVCASGQLTPGGVQLLRLDSRTGVRSKTGDLFVANLATKDDWRDPSKIEWVEKGLKSLGRALEERGVTSIAVPMLGAGLGGLPWPQVRDVVEKTMTPYAERGMKIMVLGDGPQNSRSVEQSLKTPQARADATTPSARVLNVATLSGKPDNVVYIGRNPAIWRQMGGVGAPKWGNPFVMGKDGDRDAVVAKYDRWIDAKLTDPAFRDDFMKSLKGKDQACHCAPQGCHGHVNVRKIDEISRGVWKPARDVEAQSAAPVQQALPGFDVPTPKAAPGKAMLADKRAAGAILGFQGENRWLSNFVSKPVVHDGITYPTVEHAYQAAKTVDLDARRKVAALSSPAEAKKAGRTLAISPDWDARKSDVMAGLLAQKFAQEPYRANLAATKGREIVELNTWGDRTWGMVARADGALDGENRLGRMIMAERDKVLALEHGSSGAKNEVHSQSTSIPARADGGATSPVVADIITRARATVGTKPERLSFAGIGSRETPPEMLRLQKDASAELARRGVMLRSGAANGADTACEEGVDAVKGPKEIYLPWAGFQNRKPDGKTTFVAASPEHDALAAHFHPAPDRLSRGAKALMGRNGSQMLGRDLDDPTGAVLCYTPNGAGSGGTGQAIRLARAISVPVIDLGSPAWKGFDAAMVADVIEAAARGRDHLAVAEKLKQAAHTTPANTTGRER